MAFPTTEDRIAAAEKQLGKRLPAEYRNRLISRNGGELETAGDVWEAFPVFDDTDAKRASRTANHLVRETQLASKDPGFPDKAVAIASNGSGDLLVFLAGAGDAFDGRLQLLNHETKQCKPTALDFT